MNFPWRVLLRDILLAILCFCFWIEIEIGTSSIFLHVLLALLTTLLAFFAHEWGHFFGGRLFGAKLLIDNRFTSFFLFKIYKVTTKKSFIALSLGGYLASIFMVLFFILTLPQNTLATTITLFLVAIGVIITLVLEVPELFRVVKSGQYPKGFAYTDNNNVS